MNVLYVEDYALGAALVRDTFRRRAPEIQLEIVSTVAQALARLNRFELGGDLGGDDRPHYDVVLTDLNLPDGLGLEILSHVRSRRLMLAVVILTGSGDEDTVVGALHAGANDYVTKRDDYLTVLPRTLHAALGRFRSEAARASTPLQVLCADADTATLETVRSELNRRAPHIVIESANSADAVLRRLRPDAPGPAPDVLLLDDRLPGLPVIELLKQVAALPRPELPVVLVTAQGNERIAQLAIRIGVADYLNKSDGYLQRLPFALEGAHLKALGARERAALRRSEAEYRALVNNLPDVVIRFDREGRHLYVSPPMEAISGKPTAYFIGRTHAELGAPPELAELFRAALQRVFADAGQQRIEFEGDVPAGRRAYEAVLTPEYGAGGAVETVLAIARDVTERREQEARIAHYRDELEAQVATRTDELARANAALTLARDAADAANHAKTRFLADMSHEIRTPMGAILGLARLLRAELPPGRPLDYVAKLQQSGDHLLRIVNDVLDLSKIEAGQLELEDAAFSLREVVTHAIDMLQPRASEKGLALELNVDAALPPYLRGDALRLEQIVLNFLVNAIKFTSHGTIHVRALHAGARLRIEVQDSGIGMTPQQQARLFQPFAQGNSSTAREFGGSGLGLVIARHLASLMHGEVGVVSESQRGSTFWLDLPLRDCPADALAARADSAPAWVAPPAGTRVLLADDDPVNQLVISQLLRELGFEVDVVDDGAEAVARVRAGRYAMVLMDLHMPRLDGLEATRQIRALDGAALLPIIAMTASAFEEDRRRCIDAGMSDHVAKPIDPAQLQDVATRCLRG